MVVVKVKIPPWMRKSFEWKTETVDLRDFLLQLEQAEENMWVDEEIDPPIPMQEFARILREDIYLEKKLK